MLLCVLVVVTPAERLGQVLGRDRTGVLVLQENKKPLETQKHLTTFPSHEITGLVQGFVLR